MSHLNLEILVRISFLNLTDSSVRGCVGSCEIRNGEVIEIHFETGDEDLKEPGLGTFVTVGGIVHGNAQEFTMEFKVSKVAMGQ